MSGPGDTSDSAMCALLLTAYGIRVDSAERVTPAAGGSTGSVQWMVEATDGRTFEVQLHRGVRDVTRAQTAVDVSEHCRAHQLPTATAVSDQHGSLVSATADGSGYTVTVPVPGVRATTPLTLTRARAAGALLGRLHHVLSGYPLPAPRPQDDQSVFLAAPLNEVPLAVHTDQEQAGTSLPGDDRRQLDAPGARRSESIRLYLERARSRVPAGLTLHAVHGAFTADNLWFTGDAITGLTGFRAPTGYPALELARLAFGPLTVAGREDWIDVALAVVGAYQNRHPYLPATEIRACADIALLALLAQTPRHPGGPSEAWETADQAAGRVAEHLDELHTALEQAALAKGSSR
ncbi:phosphotransferase enzyme family protein [Streptomyces sp. CA-111067]|uniref:phosphotransferase enzyme family protein n=1 Tax=Streptomyces sp. CA-111067 TaxID=3240046 RepID=UPI003D99130B